MSKSGQCYTTNKEYDAEGYSNKCNDQQYSNNNTQVTDRVHD